jgi:hypothetical protein
VLRATFPAGTVSGAPKIRALEVIREFEPIRRNVYSGRVGYIGWHGDADTAIAIRTAVIQDGRLHVQAGAGIVHDSDPQKEWEETMNKGRALFHAWQRPRAASERGASAPRQSFRPCRPSPRAVEMDRSRPLGAGLNVLFTGRTVDCLPGIYGWPCGGRSDGLAPTWS